MGIYLALDSAKMFYDDVGELAAARCTTAQRQSLGLTIEFKDLPHLSTRFIGYEDANRQTLSVKIGSHRPEGQAYCEAGDPLEGESTISTAHARRSLGHSVTDSDMSRLISRKQGARSMGDVRGDVFAHSTWRAHTVTTLKNRGIIKGQSSETAVRCLLDMEHCISARICEKASSKEVLPIYTNMRLVVAEPGTYAAIEQTRAEKKQAESKPVINQQINSIGFDAMSRSTMASPTSRLVLRAQPYCIDMGEGPVAD